MPTPSLQIGGCQSGLGPLTALATRMVFPPGGHAKGSICCCLPERVWAFLDQSETSLCLLLAKGISSLVRNSWTLRSSVGGVPNPLAWAAISLSNCPMPSHLPRTVVESHLPQCLGCPQLLPVTLSITGLGIGVSAWYVPHGMKMPEVPCYPNLQPWIFFIEGCLTAYSSPITYDSLIADDCGWWNNSNFWSYLQEEPWPPMPTCGHLIPQLGPLHMTPLLDPWSGHRWHRPSAGTWTSGLAWKCQQILALVPSLAGHIPTYAGCAPWLSSGSPDGCSLPSPHCMGSCWAPSSVGTLHYIPS